jgi:hypothetical protein
VLRGARTVRKPSRRREFSYNNETGGGIFSDPKTDTSVRLEGEKVVEFTKLKEFQQVTV